MDFLRIHLVINHLPVIGLPIVGLFLFVGLWKKNALMVQAGLIGLLVLSVGVMAVFQSGEEAEDLAEGLPGYREVLVENHEEAAEQARGLGVGVLLLAIVALWLGRSPWGQRLSWLTLVAAVVTTGALINTAHIGGKIRHGENPGQQPYSQ